MWPHQKSSEMVSDSFQLLRDQHSLRIPKLQTLQSRLQPLAELGTLPLIPEEKEKHTTQVTHNSHLCHTFHNNNNNNCMIWSVLIVSDCLVILTSSSVSEWPPGAAALC